MDKLLLSLEACIPAIQPDVALVLQTLIGNHNRRIDLWPLVYTHVVLKHLVVKAAEYPRKDVERARTLWFRFVSVAGTHRPQGCVKPRQSPAVDMPRRLEGHPTRATPWRRRRDSLLREFAASFARIGASRPGGASAYQ